MPIKILFLFLFLFSFSGTSQQLISNEIFTASVYYTNNFQFKIYHKIGGNEILNTNNSFYKFLNPILERINKNAPKNFVLSNSLENNIKVFPSIISTEYFKIVINLDSYNTKNLTYNLYNVSGILIGEGKLSTSENYIHIQNQPPGVFFGVIKYQDNIIHSFKCIKL